MAGSRSTSASLGISQEIDEQGDRVKSSSIRIENVAVGTANQTLEQPHQENLIIDKAPSSLDIVSTDDYLKENSETQQLTAHVESEAQTRSDYEIPGKQKSYTGIRSTSLSGLPTRFPTTIKKNVPIEPKGSIFSEEQKLKAPSTSRAISRKARISSLSKTSPSTIRGQRIADPVTPASKEYSKNNYARPTSASSARAKTISPKSISPALFRDRGLLRESSMSPMARMSVRKFDLSQ